MPHRREMCEELLRQIADAVGSVRYGCVQITIHDARIVQIETTEKVRVPQVADLTTGSASHTEPANRTSGGSRQHHGR